MKLTEFEESDYSSLYDFMSPLWYDTYGKILEQKQIKFLLDKYFSPMSIENFRKCGYRYFNLTDKSKVGVVVICENDGTTYLDKLYILPEYRGKGYAEFVFGELIKLGRDITLNVNQGNARAVSCYKKNGFAIEEEQIIPLGDGMVNIDYKMRLKKESFCK